MRTHYLNKLQYFNLNHAVKMINEAFEHGYGCYLVGSCLVKHEYRDVDIRLILSDEEYERIFDGLSGNADSSPLWQLICSSISEWLSARCGLPVDFQIQKQSEANKEFATKDGHKRSAIGI